MAVLTLTPLRLARRDRILDAAETCFVRNGFRGTRMEGVAAASGMSKVTVYGYFKDKHALFEAVASRVAERLRDAIQAELAVSGNMRDIIAAALIRKHSIVWDLVRRSKFANELFAAKNEYATQLFNTLDTEIEKKIENQIKAGHVKGAANLSKVLFASANGIANKAVSREQMAKDIEFLVSCLVPEEE